MSRSCIVIGSGLAGLSAAYALSRANWKMTVLEAHESLLGGRVRSHKFKEAPDLVCELGGEWIGDDHHRMRGLCRRFGLGTLMPHRYSSRFWDGIDRSGVYGPTDDSFTNRADEGFERLRRWFKQNQRDRLKMEALDRRSWWTELESRGYSPKDLRRRDLMDSTDFGESIRLTSAYVAAAEYLRSNDTDEVDSKIRGGNGTLIQALAEAVRADGRSCVLRDRRVKKIVQTPDHVTVSVETKHRESYQYTASFCICAAPAHAVKDIMWMPALPQRSAAAELQYSRILKTAVLYANRFWKDRKRSGFAFFSTRVSDFCFHSTFGQEGPAGILCSYAIGDKADDLAAEGDVNRVTQWITEDAVAVAEPKRSVTVTPLAMQRQPWQRESGIGGAYALYQPGQWFRVREQLLRPHQRVHFAGEHLSEKWQGFMEGAVETGQAAAKALIRA